MEALDASPFRKATVLATLTEPGAMLLMVTWTGLPDSASMLLVSVVMNCSAIAGLEQATKSQDQHTLTAKFVAA